MTTVSATVSTIDPNAICADCGDKMGDHRLAHHRQAIKRNQRGLCPHCKTPLHNAKDRSSTIAWECLAAQALGAKPKIVTPSVITNVALWLSAQPSSGVAYATGPSLRAASIPTAPSAPAPALPTTPPATPASLGVVTAHTGTPVASAPETATPPPPEAAPTTKEAKAAARRAALKAGFAAARSASVL